MSDSQSNSDLSESFDDDASDNGFTSSSSSDSSGDNESLQDSVELAKIANEMLKLPRGLCENAAIFKEFFSLNTWNLLSDNFKVYLKNKHLPTFPCVDDQAEKNKTIEMLFSNQILRFGQSPMLELQRNLEEGNYRPDVLKLRQSISKSKKREKRYQSCERISQMARQLFVSRERLLRSSYKSCPDTVYRMNRTLSRQTSLQFDSTICAIRARKRFYNEISQITEMCEINDITDDENLDNEMFDDLQKELLCKSLADEGNTSRSNFTASEKCIYGTQFKRKNDISDEEATRALYESKQPKLSNRNFRQYLLEHKRRRIVEPNLPEYETIDIRLRDVYARAQVGGNFKRVFASGKTPGRKPKSKLKSLNTQIPTLSNNIRERLPDQDNECMSSTKDSKISKDAAELDAILKDKLDENTITPTNKIDIQTEQSNSSNVKHKEVEMPHMEIQTFDSNTTCEETIPAFIISNEVVLPHTEQQEYTNSPNQNNDWQERSSKTETAKVDNSSLVPTLSRTESVYNSHLPQNAIEDNCNRSDLGTLDSNNFQADNDIYTTEDVKDGNYTHPEILNSGTALKSQISSIPSSSPELIQETHSCFFSLIRDFFCSTPNHRMKFDELSGKINVWLCNPITALNDWYSLADNWSTLLNSAIHFLAGDSVDQPEEYVPYIEYKTQQNIYQWIGAGRDSDARLLELSQFWLMSRNKNIDKSSEHRIESNLLSIRRRSTEIEDSNLFERGISPPPLPRCPTTWTVTAASPAEVEEFQRQERERFENPHRAYTYRMHGYESVVGPVKGIYSQILALTKARGHSMMIGDRPNFVTILTLVRDATARLPNGEGTRADISELLKCSQYINRDAAENVLQTIVSGALDRMHTEHDPCVRYDPKRKIWIYLHRNRTEEEFERMHQQYQGLGKHKKPSNRKTKPKALLKDGNDIDFIGNNSIMTTQPGSSNINSLPALVPANPIIVNSSFTPSMKQQLPKYPPVPPLKYNIQPNQPQKSLLKSTLQPQRSADLKSVESKEVVQLEAGSQYLANIQNSSYITTTATAAVTTSAATSLATTSSKSFSLSVAPSKSTNIVSSNNTTPIIVATPTGLKTVHVSNATSVTPSNPSPSIQLVRSDSRSVIQGSGLSATVGGKKVALNKPIIINQISPPTQQKNKSPQAPKPLQKPQQQNFILPVNLNSAPKEQPTLFPDNVAQKPTDTRNIQTIFMENPKVVNNDNAQLGQQTPKNIIRLVPSVSSSGKQLISFPISNAKPPVQIIGQRVITNSSLRPQLLQKSVGGISLITSNASLVSPAPIVRMSSQAFASLQQKQNQHVLVKSSPMQPNRLVMGKPSINAHIPTSNKNIIVQQIPGTIVSNSKINASQGQSTNNIAKGISSVISISPQLASAKGQQQKVLLQNLRQQPMQFKTVQVVSSNTQQSNTTARLSTGQTMKLIATNSSASIVKTSPQQNKTVSVVVSQPQGLSCLVKTSSPQQSTKEVASVSTETSEMRTTNNTTGQIISLDGLLAKQGRSIRVTNSTAGKTQTGNIIQLTPSNANQDSTQYAVVSQARNLISVGNPQQGGSTNVFSTPIAISMAQSKDATKYISSSSKVISSPQLVDTNMFSKTTAVSVPSSSINSGVTNNFRVITSSSPANFNIANIQGKQVILTSKTAGTITATTSSAQKLHNSAIILSGQSAKLQGNQNVKLLNKGGVITSQPNAQMQTVIMGNQILRVDQLPPALKQQLQNSRIAVSTTSTVPITTIANTSTGTVVINSNDTLLNQPADRLPKTLILGSSGQAIRLQSASQQAGSVVKNVVVNAQKTPAMKPPPSRVVLAVQGGGQIFLSPNYQGGAVNLKSLQNVKVVSVSQAQSVSVLDDQQSKTSVQKSMLRPSSSGADES